MLTRRRRPVNRDGRRVLQVKPANIIKRLGLTPLEPEGGLHRQTYLSPESVSSGHLPDRYGGDRRFCSAIYYLLEKGTVSKMHRLLSDEIYHFYAGNPVQLLSLSSEGSSLIFLGKDIMAGQRPQAVVPAGVWQGMALVPGGEFALMGTTVAPAYTPEDFELGDPEKLSKQFPGYEGFIKTLSV